ncbi:hypothetical protein [Actinomadura rupiterrae]|uniref:hypothetical protein n=1 Tax=Actinomadura rupiterrae TaxID=559627 RepID=UPI0020A432D2|nr:hypothetical protein [Actinomadura rupiterrae]MCP2335308.1 hypothetical protein [Actinomadura rupiterrae]
MRTKIPQLVGVVAGVLLLCWGAYRLTAAPGCEGTRMNPDDRCTTSTRGRVYTQTYEERKRSLHMWGYVLVVGGPALSLSCLAGMAVSSRRRSRPPSRPSSPPSSTW